MTTARTIALTAAFLATPLLGCDAEAPGPSNADYRAIGHIDLATVKATPWLKDALGDKAFDLDGELDACGDVLKQAESITFGAGEDAFEVYVRGPIDADAANGCSDHIDAEVAKKASADRPTPEAVMLADDLFVVFGGDVTPSQASLRSLLAADPSPKGGTPIWGLATTNGKDDPVKHVTMWADPGKGLDAHVEVQFDDEAKAAETFGKATLGLTALQLSGEAGELASAVQLDADGDTMTVEVHATPDQLKTVIDKAKAKGKAGGSVRAKAHAGHAPDGDHGTFHIQIGSSSE